MVLPTIIRPLAKRSILLSAFVLLASCRLVITTGDMGYITSESGRYDCAEPSCAFDITEKVTDTFVAVPAQGYRFIKWQGLCTAMPTAVCETWVAPLAEEHAEHDGDIGLSVVFELSSTVRTWYRDEDGDHYGADIQSKRSAQQPEGFVALGNDCNDLDPDIHPWTKELHDAQDNNCNGLIDEGHVDIAFYLDSDGDGFGDPDFLVMSKRKPAHHSANNFDCNDLSAEDYPEAPEQDDNRDNDCDGEVDEGGNLFFRDVDGDGFGDAEQVAEAFEPLPGYVDNDEDCDDSNAQINPIAPEEFDSVDNDCDGLVDEGFTLRTYYLDTDGDGYGDDSHYVVDIAAPPGYVLNNTDNCIDIANPTQIDADEDGIGDACDPVDNSAPEPEPEPEPVDCTMTAEKQSMLDAVNAFRVQPRTCGATDYPAISPVTWNCELESAAARHSSDMANNDFFSHTGSDGSTVSTRATAAGYSWYNIGENIAAGYTSVSSVMQGWINSPGHCANMMNSNFRNFGFAKISNASSQYGAYWTQVFGKPK